MTNSEHFYDLLEKQLENNLSPAESRQLATLAEESPETLKSFQEMLALDYQMSQALNGNFRENDLWHAVKKDILKETGKSDMSLKVVASIKGEQKASKISRLKVFSAAASIILMLGLFASFLIKDHFSEKYKSLAEEKFNVIQAELSPKSEPQYDPEKIPRTDLKVTEKSEVRVPENVEVSDHMEADTQSDFTEMAEADADNQLLSDQSGVVGKFSGLGAGPTKRKRYYKKGGKKGKYGYKDIQQIKPLDPKTWKPSKVPENQVRLMIGEKEELLLETVQMVVQIDGPRARVLLDCYFYNDKDKQFEGTFKLRLPNGASPCFLAFGQSKYKFGDDYLKETKIANADLNNLNGLLKSQKDTWNNVKLARMVTRTNAAIAYRMPVRKRIDPALMEWSGSNIFSARVFPLLALPIAGFQPG